MGPTTVLIQDPYLLGLSDIWEFPKISGSKTGPKWALVIRRPIIERSHTPFIGFNLP